MGLTGRSHKHYSKLQQDDPDDESDGSAKEGADPWFKGDLSARSAGDPRGEQGQAKGLMSGITSWGARDIREWRKELDDAAKDYEFRRLREWKRGFTDQLEALQKGMGK